MEVLPVDSPMFLLFWCQRASKVAPWLTSASRFLAQGGTRR